MLKNFLKRIINKIKGIKSTPVIKKPTNFKDQMDVMLVVRMKLQHFEYEFPHLYSFNNSIDYWTNFVTAMAFAESNYNTNCIFMEPAPLFYESLGLLQLSHEDIKNYKTSGFDISGEKIFIPENNIGFGLFVLDQMVRLHGNPISNKSHYWSCLNTTKAGYKNFKKKFDELQGWNK